MHGWDIAVYLYCCWRAGAAEEGIPHRGGGSGTGESLLTAHSQKKQ